MSFRVIAFTGRNERGVYLFIAEQRAARSSVVTRDSGFQPFFIVAIGEFRFKVASPAFVSFQRALCDDLGKIDHAMKLANERHICIALGCFVLNADTGKSLIDLFELNQRFGQIRIVANYGDILCHQLAHFLMQAIGVFAAIKLQNASVIRFVLCGGCFIDALGMLWPSGSPLA